jgi:hypothetical protein
MRLGILPFRRSENDRGIEVGFVKRLDKLAGVVLTRRLDGKIVARADRCTQVQIRRADEPRTPRMNPVGR